jgi:hypothetical protein
LPQLRGRNAPGQRVKLAKVTDKRKTPRLELPGAVAFITKKVYISGVRKYFLQVSKWILITTKYAENGTRQR